jgi:hypothetical protein
MGTMMTAGNHAGHEPGGSKMAKKTVTLTGEDGQTVNVRVGDRCPDATATDSRDRAFAILDLRSAVLELQSALKNLGKAGERIDTANLGQAMGQVADVIVKVEAEANRLAYGQTDSYSCPACSGHGKPMAVGSAFLVCQSCDGLFTIRPVRRVVAQAFVKLDDPMQANAGACASRYFDFDLKNSTDNPSQVTRVHGWFDPNSKRVVQWG